MIPDEVGAVENAAKELAANHGFWWEAIPEDGRKAWIDIVERAIRQFGEPPTTCVECHPAD